MDIPGVDKGQLLEDCKSALYAAKICSYAQGMNLIQAMSAEKEWGVDLGECARIWKGCVRLLSWQWPSISTLFLSISSVSTQWNFSCLTLFLFLSFAHYDHFVVCACVCVCVAFFFFFSCLWGAPSRRVPGPHQVGAQEPRPAESPSTPVRGRPQRPQHRLAPRRYPRHRSGIPVRHETNL